ncbi:MAG: ribonuclease P protein component [Rhodospirillaceae bacterium]|jgi:ribonuclease P protein component|nr:ribonuclease P protein component [Rhodospirillaceae bacterium]MBT5659208.1 ribonuclease P protein component [Rhodospirillaceae bacterium]
MTPVIGRLKRRPEFLKVAAAKRKSVAPGLVLQALKRDSMTAKAALNSRLPTEGETRIGYTASRKVGPSVARNRARRRLRAAVAKILPLHARPGYDLVLIARKGTLTRPFAKLLGDLEASLKKLDVYCNQAGNKEAL